MPTDLYHLVYQSLATVPFNEAELEALLSQSRAWNQAHGLTGILLYGDGGIMQVLEGMTAEVNHIFDRIAHDSRHMQIVKLSDGPISDRSFSQWSMGFKAVRPEDFAQLQGYVNPAGADYLAGPVEQDTNLRAVLALFVAGDLVGH